MNNKYKRNKTRQEFLLTFFTEDGYCEKKVNGFWLVQQFNQETKKHQVAIYKEEEFRKYKSYGNSTRNLI